VLRALLEHYAKIDDDVEMVLNFMMPLFVEIDAGRVVPPQRDEYRWYFFNTESPLFLKYDDLSRAEAEYAEALEGWSISYIWQLHSNS
jgi:hypothetical protein